LDDAAQVIKVACNLSMLCTTTVSPSRTKASSLSSSGVSLPEALSVNTLPTSICSVVIRILVEAARERSRYVDLPGPDIKLNNKYKLIY
jgi:hypothetical protein